MAAIERMNESPPAYVLSFSVGFLDGAHDLHPDRTESLLRNLGEFIPADLRLRVEGGTENEMLHPLDLAPYPGRPARALLSDGVISADLDRLASLQQEDGGWIVDFRRISPAGSLDWRGYATVRAIDILRRNGRG